MFDDGLPIFCVAIGGVIMFPVPLDTVWINMFPKPDENGGVIMFHLIHALGIP